MHYVCRSSLASRPSPITDPLKILELLDLGHPTWNCSVVRLPTMCLDVYAC